MKNHIEVDFADGNEFIQSAALGKQVVFVDDTNEIETKLWFLLPGWPDLPVLFQYRGVPGAVQELLKGAVLQLPGVWRATFEFIEG